MIQLFKTKIGRLRVIGFLEGLSLLLLIGIAVPLKYLSGNPGMVKMLGPVHGAIFLLFLLNALSVGVEQGWKARTTGKVLAACFIPFGTFYIDRHIFRNIKE